MNETVGDVWFMEIARPRYARLPLYFQPLVREESKRERRRTRRRQGHCVYYEPSFPAL